MDEVISGEQAKDFVVTLEGKIALVTGAAGGIGSAVASSLADSGADLLLTDIKSSEGELASLAASLRDEFKVCCDYYTANVANRNDLDQLIGFVLDRYGTVDFLVNVAGVYTNEPILKFSEEKWDNLFNVNLKGVFLVCKAVAKLMVQQKCGCIINISSDSAVDVAHGDGPYATSKVGVSTFTKHLAQEIAPHNVRVNSIAPGWTKTEMTEFVWSNDKKLQAALKEIPLGFLGQPEDISNVALFLCSSASRYITGQMIVANGGRVY